MKNPTFKVKLPTKKQINEIVDMLLARNPRLLESGSDDYMTPKDLCRVVTTMYCARFIVNN